ncbi:MAG: hypothetical protein WD939_01030 [Dehalococcoidia bacterium]
MISMTRFARVPLLALAVAASFALLQSRESEPALALHHISEITEVMSGFNGDPNVQYVEITQLSAGQYIVANTRLTAFNPDGTLAGVLRDPLGSQVPLTATTWIMGTAAFEAASGISADFVFSPGILPAAGMVCWGAPDELAPAPGTWSASDPNNYVDCVSYGGASFTGANPMSPNPSAFGAGDDTQSLTRNGSSSGKLDNPWRNSDDAIDFKLADPSPTNGDGEAGVLDPNAATATPSPTSPPSVGGVSRAPSIAPDSGGGSGLGWLFLAAAALIVTVGSACYARRRRA